MPEQSDFALKAGAQPGDSAFLLNSGRHRLAFDPFPGRFIVLAFLGSAMGNRNFLAVLASVSDEAAARVKQAAMSFTPEFG